MDTPPQHCPLQDLLYLPKQTPGPLSPLNIILLTCINFSNICSQLCNAEGITSWASFFGVSNKPYAASSFSLLGCIYLQRWFSASKGFGKTVQRLSRLQYSIWVTPTCRGDNKCLLFISKNKMDMTTRMQTSCCCFSNSQHLLPSRDCIFKISLAFAFDEAVKHCWGQLLVFWPCSLLPSLLLLHPQFPFVPLWSTLTPLVERY